MANYFTPNYTDYKFICEKCHFKSNKTTDFNRHLLTPKHKRLTETNYLHQKNSVTLNKFICECGKKYIHHSSLCKHKKQCIIEDSVEEESYDNVIDKDELIMILVKQNAELIKEQTDIKHMMLKVIENGTYNTNITNTNSHNKAFNLNFFLNETCKDAMNITEFVDSIKLQLTDLEDVGRVGYIEGISNIIIKNLNDLDETKRPLHCTDKKREIIYIKDEGHWEKEDDNKSKIKRLISKVSSKNSRLLTEYREKYPDCKKCDSRISDKFNKMVIEAMGGPGENNKEKEERIIRNIAKSITISRNNET